MACSPSGESGSTRRLEAANDGATPVPTTPTDVFQHLRESFTESTFRADYREVGPDTDGVTSTLTMYKGGPDRLRLDITGQRDGDEVEIVVVDTADHAGFCLRNAGEFGQLFGVEAHDGICFDRDPGAVGGEISAMLEMLRSPSFEVLRSTRREVAGEDAKCYLTRAPYDQIRSYCFSAEGALLAAADETGAGIEAADVVREIDDGAFDLPYEVHALPTLDAVQ